MKTNVLMKIAVVFMAAFGAYAFSGNTSSQQSPFTEVYYLDENDVCTNILAKCSKTGNESCMILINDVHTDVFDLTCEQSIKHNKPEYVEWN